MRMIQTLMKYQQSVDRLINEGVFPEMTMFDLALATKFERSSRFDDSACRRMIEHAATDGTLDVLQAVPGPWRETKTEEEQIELINLIFRAFIAGSEHALIAKWQEQYGDKGLGSNIVIPRLQPRGTGTSRANYLIARVIVADPDDAARVARVHIRKEGNFTGLLYDSLIATTDNDHWKKQRHALMEAFLPKSTLAEIMPVSQARAKHCAARMAKLAAQGPVDVSDFLLHEAQAQLQMALLGTTEEMMERTNEDVRAAFMGDLEHGKIGVLGSAMKGLMEHAATNKDLALPGDGRPVKGPLSRSVQASDLPAADDYGNMLLILFAGHDTTGHTMTWLLFELARHPELLREVQQETDAFMRRLGGRDPRYQDLSHGLELLDRCVTESLRLWPAVANGTYRQLQFADGIRGLGGEEIMLPKGTAVQVINWSRHRNAELWGADVNEFNPKRAFEPGEIARVGGPGAATNPQSDRFSPFAHNPRSCLGKNFASWRCGSSSPSCCTTSTSPWPRPTTSWARTSRPRPPRRSPSEASTAAPWAPWTSSGASGTPGASAPSTP